MSGASDEYSRKHMASEGVILRDKARSGKGFQWLMLVPTVLFVVLGLGAAFTPLWPVIFPCLLLTLMFVFGYATLSAVRTVVTESVLNVQVGIWGPSVPHERIRSIRVVPEGSGIRVGKRLEPGGWVSSYLVRHGEHVELTYLEDDGEARRLRFSADDPAAVVAAVNRARGRRIEVAEAVSDVTAEEDLLAEDEVDEARARR